MFAPSWVSYLRGKKSGDFKTVILGCQRSGTTLLKEVLSSSELFMFEENWMLPYFYRERWHACGVWHRDDDIDTQEQVIWDDAVRRFVDNSYGVHFQLNRQKRHRSWGTKSPGLNMARASTFIQKIFPGVKFVILIRDPRDTFASMKASPKMIFHLPADFYKNAINSPDLLELSMTPHAYWGLVYSTLDRLTEAASNSCYVIKYEDLLKDPLGNVKKLCDFLSIAFRSQMLEPFCRQISNASKVSMSYEDYLSGNYSISQSAIGRWKNDLNDEDCGKVIESNRFVAEKWSYSIG